jgi:hypothetical protein
MYRNVEYLTVRAGNFRIGTNEFSTNGSPTKVGTHAEVGNRGDECNGSSNVVEDAMCTWQKKLKPTNTKVATVITAQTAFVQISYGAKSFNVKTYPVPVGPMSCDCNTSSPAVIGVWIDVESVVTHLC